MKPRYTLELWQPSDKTGCALMSSRAAAQDALAVIKQRQGPFRAYGQAALIRARLLNYN